MGEGTRRLHSQWWWKFFFFLLSHFYQTAGMYLKLRKRTKNTFSSSTSCKTYLDSNEKGEWKSDGLICFTDPLVLRGPPAVFEGDSVVLRCHAKKGTSRKTLTFYKNGVPLESSGQSSELTIQHADQRANGQYHCTMERFWSRISSNTVRVQVQGTTLTILKRLLVIGRLSAFVEAE